VHLAVVFVSNEPRESQINHDKVWAKCQGQWSSISRVEEPYDVPGRSLVSQSWY
jgi:hypothetical protein